MNDLSNHVQGMRSCQGSCEQEKVQQRSNFGVFRCATPRAGCGTASPSVWSTRFFWSDIPLCSLENIYSDGGRHSNKCVVSFVS